MSLQKLMRNYASYNLWANEATINWLKTKPVHLLDEHVSSSFPSIAKTFAHLWATERFWYHMLKGEKPGWWSPQGTATEIMDGLLQQSAAFVTYVHAQSEAELLEDCVLDTRWANGVRPRYQFIQHCLNHGAYHRGQIVTIARNTGITDPPMTDYIFYNLNTPEEVTR